VATHFKKGAPTLSCSNVHRARVDDVLGALAARKESFNDIAAQARAAEEDGLRTGDGVKEGKNGDAR
jgi:hypothetical protein